MNPVIAAWQAFLRESGGKRLSEHRDNLQITAMPGSVGMDRLHARHLASMAYPSFLAGFTACLTLVAKTENLSHKGRQFYKLIEAELQETIENEARSERLLKADGLTFDDIDIIVDHAQNRDGTVWEDLGMGYDHE